MHETYLERCQCCTCGENGHDKNVAPTSKDCPCDSRLEPPSIDAPVTEVASRTRDLGMRDPVSCQTKFKRTCPTGRQC